jgi:hypothetical protein
MIHRFTDQQKYFLWFRHMGMAALLVMLGMLLAACAGDQAGTETEEATSIVEPTEAAGRVTEGDVDRPLADDPTMAAGRVPEDDENQPITGQPTEAAGRVDEPGDVVLPGEAEELDIEGTEVELEDIADNPEEYLGQTVTVSGEVSEVLSPQVFRMNEGNLLDIGDEILVVHLPEQTPVVMAEDAEIQVTGTVRSLIQAEIERDFDFGLDEDLYIEYENRPAIVATSFDVMEAE